MMIFSGLLVSTGWAKDKVLLRLNGTKGKVYNITSVIKTQTFQTINEKDMKSTLENVIKMKYIIDDVDSDGNITITATYKEIKTKQSGSQGNFEYDSENPTDPVPPAAKGLVALIGTSFTGKIDSRGKVLEIQGLDVMINKMLNNLGTDQNDPNTAKVLASLKNNLAINLSRKCFKV
jgi:hypothetical protein